VCVQLLAMLPSDQMAWSVCVCLFICVYLCVRACEFACKFISWSNTKHAALLLLSLFCGHCKSCTYETFCVEPLVDDQN